MALKLENPSVNSVRMQRAYRINQVEKGRLNNRVACLDHEKLRRLRLVNQDIRMINLTMDFITSSSGRSEEGMSPDDVIEEEVAEEVLPCFLYGERTNSRRFGKNTRRVHSAITLRRASSDSESSHGSGRRMRPFSGPAGKHSSMFLTTGVSDTESVFSDSEPEDQQRTKSRSNSIWKSSDAGFSNPMKEPVRRSSSRRTMSSDSRPSSSMSRGLLESHRLDGVQGFASSPHASGRLSRMANQVPRQNVKSADNTRSTGRKWTSPALVGMKSHQTEQALENKKDMNKERAAAVNDKLKAFMVKMPVRRY